MPGSERLAAAKSVRERSTAAVPIRLCIGEGGRKRLGGVKGIELWDVYVLPCGELYLLRFFAFGLRWGLSCFLHSPLPYKSCDHPASALT